MESQYQDSTNGGVTNVGEVEYVAVGKKRKMVGWGYFLRAAAAGLSLAAAVVLGLDNQKIMVALPTLPQVIVPVTAKWHYLSAFVYFVVVNAMASVYGVVSLLLALASTRCRKSTIIAMIIVSDVLAMVMLFSSFGAAAAVGLIGREGNSHVQWRKVCDVFEKFCVQGAAALFLSGGASLMFFMLVAIAIFNIRNKN